MLVVPTRYLSTGVSRLCTRRCGNGCLAVALIVSTRCLLDPSSFRAAAELLTSVRLGDRTLKRSVAAWVNTSTIADRRTMLGRVDERIRAAHQPVVYDGEPEGLDALYQQLLRKNFARIDAERSGVRVAMSYWA